MQRTTILALFVLSACAEGLEDPTFPTGSQSIVASRDGEHVYVANPEEGTLSTIGTGDGAVAELALGVEPTRVARLGDRVLVTLRGERTVVVLRAVGGTLGEERRLEVGVEPVGIVAAEDGSRFFVAASLSGRVEAWDADTMRRTASFSVPGEPRWLALHPGGRALYVGSHVGGRLSVIDLEDGTVSEVTLPERETFPVSTVNLDVAINPETGGVPMPRRITGDPAISADGEHLAVPVLHVDNINGEETPVEEGSGFYGSGGRFNPGIVVVDLDLHGLPTDDVRLYDPSGFDTEGVRISSVLSSVTWSPDGEALVAPMEGAEAIAFVEADPPSQGVAFGPPRSTTMEVLFPSIRLVTTAAGPRGVAFTAEDRAWSHAFIGRAVEALPVSQAKDGFGEQGSTQDPVPMGPFAGEARAIAVPFSELLRATTLATSAAPTLSSVEEIGRALFFTSRNPSVSDPFSGLSCGTCHAGGRADGITWPLFEGRRQTPSLAGSVEDTAPYTWTGDVPTIAHEAMLTSEGRMGGTGLEPVDAAAVEAYIRTLRTPDAPGRGEDNPTLSLGREIFYREDVGCGSCHSGKLYTDNQSYDMFGLTNVGTRALDGILASAPYLHDGSAPDLRSVLTLSAAGEMGDASMLDDEEMEALLAFVESL